MAKNLRRAMSESPPASRSPSPAQRHARGSEEKFFFYVADKAHRVAKPFRPHTSSRRDSTVDDVKAADLFAKHLRKDEVRKERMTRGSRQGWRIAINVTGTVLPILCTDALFMTCVLLFAALRTCVLLGYIPTDDAVEFRGTTLLGSAVTFYLVFYASQSYDRFRRQYQLAMDAVDDVHVFTSLALASLSRERALRIIRRLHASQMLGFIGLAANDADVMLRGCNHAYHLMPREELDCIVNADLYTVDPAAALIHWIVKDLNEAIATAEVTLVRGEQINIRALSVRHNLARLYHIRDQELPFLYVHLANLLSMVYLPLLTVALAISASEAHAPVLWEIQNAAALIFTCVFFLGLRETARVMSDPFGNDEYDLPLIGFGVTMIERCRDLVTLHDPAAERLGSAQIVEGKELST